MAIKTTSVRVDSADLEQAKEVLDILGLGFNAYVNMAIKQLVYRRAVPFEVKAPDTPAESGGLSCAPATAIDENGA